MITEPMDVLKRYEIRKSKKQKQQFRDAAQAYFQNLGYPVNIEKGSLGARNVVIGDTSTAKYLVTAHYDTCARMPIPNFITPRSFWGFIGYQLLTTLVLLLPDLLVYGIVYWITHNVQIAFICWYVLLIAEIVLLTAGPANPHTANDNTSGVVAVMQLAQTLPEDKRRDYAFVLFDLEESGLIGSSSYRKKHRKESSQQIILNLDCIGDGDEIWLFPSKKVRKDLHKMDLIKSMSGQHGQKDVFVHERGFSVYPSDQANFPYGVGICALKKTRRGLLYMDKIHTKHDTMLDINNVNILCQRLAQLDEKAV